MSSSPEIPYRSSRKRVIIINQLNGETMGEFERVNTDEIDKLITEMWQDEGVL